MLQVLIISLNSDRSRTGLKKESKQTHNSLRKRSELLETSQTKSLPCQKTPPPCLLVRISSCQCGHPCPPVIIKEKDERLGAEQRHQHASLLLCSPRLDLSNPPAPDGPIYYTKRAVFGCALRFQIFF